MSQQADTIPAWTLGDRLRKARAIAGIETDEMARDIGRTRRTITNYENDATTAPLLVVRQYAMRCSVPFEWLSTGEITTSMQVTACYPVWAPFSGEDAA